MSTTMVAVVEDGIIPIPPLLAAAAPPQARDKGPVKEEHSVGIDGTEVGGPSVWNEAERFRRTQQETAVPLVDARRKALVHRMSSEIVKFFPGALRSTANRESVSTGCPPRRTR